MSIRENELRVGVYILYCEKVFQVDAECINMHWGDDLDDAYRPIPLTEEWLLKLGFFKYKGNNLDCFLNGFETACNMTMLFWKGNQIKNINYVHQLQNLYFALTGQELTISEYKEIKTTKAESIDEAINLVDEITEAQIKK